MAFRKSCFLYLEFILVFVGKSQEFNGYVKGMQIQSSFRELCQVGVEEIQFRSFL